MTTEKESKKLNLFEKIQAVSTEVMNIEKDMTVGKGSYSYKAVSDTSVTLAVKKAEAKHRIISIPIRQDLVSSETIKQIKDNKESILFVENVKMTVRIIDLDKTDDFIEVETFGKGVDNGDKGFGKASTYARKYALLNAYKIATGEDPDADKSEPLEVITVDQKKIDIISVCEKDAVLKKNVLSHFGAESFDDLTDKNIETIHDQFKAKNRLS